MGVTTRLQQSSIQEENSEAVASLSSECLVLANVPEYPKFVAYGAWQNQP
jgi:hypothetical protein